MCACVYVQKLCVCVYVRGGGILCNRLDYCSLAERRKDKGDANKICASACTLRTRKFEQHITRSKIRAYVMNHLHPSTTTHAFAQTRLTYPRTYAQTHTQMHTHTLTHTHAHAHTCTPPTHTNTHTHTHINALIHLPTNMHTHIHTHTHTSIPKCKSMHTNTRTYTQTYIGLAKTIHTHTPAVPLSSARQVPTPTPCNPSSLHSIRPLRGDTSTTQLCVCVCVRNICVILLKPLFSRVGQNRIYTP